MILAADQILVWTASVIWPFVRISALFLAAPIFGARTVNARVRLGLSLLLAMIVAPRLENVPLIDPLSLAGVVVAIHQVLIGIAMGFVMQMVFSAVTQAGEGISLSMGLSFASAIDPVAGVQVPVVAQFYVILTTLLFLALNGHLVLIELLVISFDLLPIAASGLGAQDFWTILSFGSVMFASALLIALPAMASLLAVNLAMGVVARAAPQLNIFAVGFPAMIMAGFVLIILIMPGFIARVNELMFALFDLIQTLIGG